MKKLTLLALLFAPMLALADLCQNLQQSYESQLAILLQQTQAAVALETDPMLIAAMWATYYFQRDQLLAQMQAALSSAGCNTGGTSGPTTGGSEPPTGGGNPTGGEPTTPGGSQPPTGGGNPTGGGPTTGGEPPCSQQGQPGACLWHHGDASHTYCSLLAQRCGEGSSSTHGHRRHHRSHRHQRGRGHQHHPDD